MDQLSLVASGFVVFDDSEEVADEPKAPGIQVWFLRPYSPELSAVEECGSKVKAIVRAADPRTAFDVIDATGHAIGQVTPQDAMG